MSIRVSLPVGSGLYDFYKDDEAINCSNLYKSSNHQGVTSGSDICPAYYMCVIVQGSTQCQVCISREDSSSSPWLLLFSAVSLLLSNAVTSRRDKSILYNRGSIGALLTCCYLGLMSFDTYFLIGGVGLFGGLFNSTPVGHTFHVFLLIIAIVIMQLTAFYPRKLWLKAYSSPYYIMFSRTIYSDAGVISKMGHSFAILEYPLMLLFIITGGMFVMSSSDIVSIFIAVELQSYGLYLVATLYRDSELSTSGGLTYFLIGGLSSCFILLGTSLLYANSGATCLEGYYLINTISSFMTAAYHSADSSWYSSVYLQISLLIMSIGFLAKSSAAPFHFWSPDVYDSVPTVVTTFIAITAKISILILLLEIVHYTSDYHFTSNFIWTDGLLLSSYISLIIGAVLGLSQPRIKKLFAYSTISHLGFILLALAINSVESIQAFIFYLMGYTVANLNAFIILSAIGFSLYPYASPEGLKQSYKDLPEKNYSPIQLTDQLKGYYNINPVLAISLVITLFSFIGIPPLLGFFAKQMVLSAALDSGYIFIALTAIVTSVISAGYYLAVINKVIFDDNPLAIAKGFVKSSYWCTVIFLIGLYKNKKVHGLGATYNIHNITLSSYLTITISILTLILLLFMFASGEWLTLTRLLSIMLYNP